MFCYTVHCYHRPKSITLTFDVNKNQTKVGLVFYLNHYNNVLNCSNVKLKNQFHFNYMAY